MKKIAILALGALLLTGCAHKPVYDVQSHAVPVSAQKLSPDKIKDTIIAAGQNRGWTFQPIAPDVLRATQDQPKYAATVDIRYSQTSYSITYVNSRGLEAQNGTIHSHYNFWIRNLENDIDTWLNNAAYRSP